MALSIEDNEITDSQKQAEKAKRGIVESLVRLSNSNLNEDDKKVDSMH